ncbi:membrane-associated protein, putative [Bodo saltans]|uniref:Membrane-associated protein, putative n=1 Tax=Bodo saltans TaxID=75058 RepID=A0A0S4JQN6_BODSA|nr:membrane-associated protein, putative [Bodo saltans]|eukprot:CUG93840.1 membrane-associated protein, putative [Bodo saltans]
MTFLLLLATQLLLAVASSDSASSSDDSTVVAYVGMSASVVVSSSVFDAPLFQSELVTVLDATSSQLVIVTYYPSSNASLTIVEFVVLSSAQSSAVSLATRLLTTDLNGVTSDQVQNIIVDSTVAYQPSNSTIVVSGTTESVYSSRDPGDAPEVLMWIITALWVIFFVVFVWRHFQFVVNDRSLYYEPFIPLSSGIHGTLLTSSFQPTVSSSSYVPPEVDDHDDLPSKEEPLVGKDQGSPKNTSLLEGYHFDEPIGCISIGLRHICFTTGKGVFVWGENKWGQLGLGSVSAKWVTAASFDSHDEESTYSNEEFFSLREVFEPEHPGDLGAEQGWELTASDGNFVCQAVRHWLMEECCGGIRDVACGAMHTIWLSAEEGVFVCGSNASGQLGLSTSTTQFPNSIVPVPQPLDMSSCTDFAIVAIAAGAFHSSLLDENGVVFLFGLTHDGQHLTAEGLDNKENPSPIRKLDLKMMTAKACLRGGPNTDVTQLRFVDGIQCFGAHTLVFLSDGSIAVNGSEKDHLHKGSQIVIIQPSNLLCIVQIGEAVVIGYKLTDVDGNVATFLLRIASGTLTTVSVEGMWSLVDVITAEFNRATNFKNTKLISDVLERSVKAMSSISSKPTLLIMPIPAVFGAGSWLMFYRLRPLKSVCRITKNHSLEAPLHFDLPTVQADDY